MSSSDRGWIAHYFATLRWRDRALDVALFSAGLYGKKTRLSHLEVEDFAFAYFVWAHSLLEWVAKEPSQSKREIVSKLEVQWEWYLTRDIANRTRHREITRAPRDAYWVSGEELSIGKLKGENIINSEAYVLHDGCRFSWETAIDSSWKMWQGVLFSMKLIDECGNPIE